jgi:hypothetical protein
MLECREQYNDGRKEIIRKGRDMVISWENLHYVGTRGQSFFKLQTSRQDRIVKKFPLGTNDIYLTNEGTVFRHRPSKRPDSLNIIQEAISTKDTQPNWFHVAYGYLHLVSLHQGF